MRALFLISIAILALGGDRTHAACTSPAAEAGAREYFSLSKNYKMCDGTNWNEFKTSSNLTACAGQAGKLDYDVPTTGYKVCDNANYVRITPTCSLTAMAYESKVTHATNLSTANTIALAADGKRAFVTAKWSQRVAVLDISNSPAAPTILGTSAAISQLENSNSMVAYGNYVFATGTGAGPGTGRLVAVDVTTNTPALAGTFQSSVASEMEHIWGVDVSSDGKYAFTVSWGSGAGSDKCWLHAINISNPASMTLASKLDVTSAGGPAIYCNYIKIRGNRAFIANDDGGALAIVDITNPALMAIEGQVTHANLVNMEGMDISTDGNYLFASVYGAANRFNVINVTNPAAPSYSTSITHAGFSGSYKVKVVSANYALVTGSTSNAVVLVNISTPTSPTVVQSFTSAGNLDSPIDIAVQGRYAYIANMDINAVTVIDLGCDPKPVVSQGVCTTAAKLEFFPTTKSLAYCNGSAYSIIAQADVTPGYIDWTNFKDISQLNSIYEIGSTVDLQLSYSNTSGTPTVQYRKNGGSWTTFTTGTPAQVSMANGDSLEFQVSGTTNEAATITVTNLSDTGTVLDTMVGTVDYDYYYYVPNYTSGTISAYKIGTDGALTQITGSPFTSVAQAYSTAVDPQGKYLYVTSRSGGTLTAYAINQTTGAVGTQISGSPYTVGNRPFQVVTTPDGKFLYVANYQSATISGFSRNISTGVLTAIAGSPWSSSNSVSDINADPSSGYLYASLDIGTNNIMGWSINATTGALTTLAAFPKTVPSNPQAVVFDGTGTRLYTGNWGADNASGYTFNSSTGALTAIAGGPWTAGDQPNGVATHPSGKYLWVANGGTANVSAFSINSGTGALTAHPGGTLTAGTTPWDVQIDPTGNFIYVANAGSASITGYKIHPLSGYAMAIPGSPFTAGTKPQAGAFAKIARP